MQTSLWEKLRDPHEALNKMGTSIKHEVTKIQGVHGLMVTLKELGAS
jgi:hypothetical protein